MNKASKLDRDTLKTLIAEARRHHKESKRMFAKYDNIDDMHDMHGWETTIAWLKSHIARTSPE